MVDRAVIRLAESGEGRIEWVAPHYRLRVGFFELALTIDHEEQTVTVLQIYRAR
jgi:mRNA-degrading endonuclease RelE of RelBE toxin-antitoxin system